MFFSYNFFVNLQKKACYDEKIFIKKLYYYILFNYELQESIEQPETSS